MLKGHEKINHLKRAQGYLWRCSVITWLLIEAIQAKGTWGPNMMNSYINPGSKNGPVKWLACFLHCCSISGRWGHRSDMRWTKRGSQSGLSANDCLASNDAQSCTFTLSASFSLYSCCASALMCFSKHLSRTTAKCSYPLDFYQLCKISFCALAHLNVLGTCSGSSGKERISYWLMSV